MTRLKPLLFEKYPDLEDKVAWEKLGDFPTPVTRLDGLETTLAHDGLWMKRDDLSHSSYGGNKVRKLEFIIGDAIRKESEWILTFGGIGSNHALAITIFAKKFDFKVVLALIDQPLTAHVQENMLLDRHFGADLSYAKNTAGAVLKGLWHLLSKRRVYFLGPGGSSEIGNLGYIEAGLELAKQIDEGVLPKPDRIYLPVGTMGTYAGLFIGLRMAGLDINLIGVRVTDKGMTNEKKLAKLINKTGKHLRSISKTAPLILVHPSEITISHKYAGREYGAPTEKGIEAVNLLRDKGGFKLETTYSGKAMACMLDDIKMERCKGENILFWNTYSSVDLSQTVAGCEDYRTLPKSFHNFFDEIKSPNIKQEL